MTILATLEKTSYAERIFAFDFSDQMDDAATIASVVSVTAAMVSGSGSLTISGAAPDGQNVKALFAGGVAGSVYQVTAKAIDTDGQKLEWDGYLAVRDV